MLTNKLLTEEIVSLGLSRSLDIFYGCSHNIHYKYEQNPEQNDAHRIMILSFVSFIPHAVCYLVQKQILTRSEFLRIRPLFFRGKIRV